MRVGSLPACGGEYPQWNVDTQTIEIARQPSGRHTSTAEELRAQPGEIVEFSVDPTRGSLLALHLATLGERIGSPLGGLSECYLPFCDGQGGVIGAIIILVGIAALIIAIERLITLTFVVAVKLKLNAAAAPNRDNPLGRVLASTKRTKTSMWKPRIEDG